MKQTGTVEAMVADGAKPAAPAFAQSGQWLRLAMAWAALATPLVAIRLWVLWGGGQYLAWQFAGDTVLALVLCGLLLLWSRWRPVRAASWPVAWLAYGLTLLVEMGEGFSYYFQAGSFNDRFFANVRPDNLRSGLAAFPELLVGSFLILAAVLTGAAWLLARQGRTRSGHPFIPGRGKALALFALAVITVCVPSAWHRLVAAVVRSNDTASATEARGHAIAAQLHAAGVDRTGVRAAPGRNLVIIYMESLERIYTDAGIFPGLTPNLNRWRAQGLDYSDYLTFTGADYTIAGLFSSQCGVPYLPSPMRALDLGGNDANATSFQPSLACLGNVLHAAGYEQTFMNGVDLSFAGVGTFFRMHGFDQVLGLKQLEDAHGHSLPQPGWGLYDSDLFRLAAGKFGKLAASGKPFNLDVLTIDNHPPHGRPSPGCPKYTANGNDILQAVHCTDYLVGRFLDAISKSPAWNNTVVVVMSDHQSMRNDAWALYPKSYKRRPLLFILNAGQGKRTMRFYHMDIAPTVLHLMGVKTNATFLAGADRSEPNAPGSPQVNSDADVAMLRKVLWARAQPLMLCKGGVLVGAAGDGVRIGGYAVPMSWRGRRRVGLRSHGAWMVAINTYGVHGAVLNSAQGLPLDGGGVAERLDRRAPNEAVLLVQPLADAHTLKQFSIDWVGRHGGWTHLADVPRLRGLEITSPHCMALLQRMNALPVGERLDLAAQFKASTAPLYPAWPRNGWLRTGRMKAMRFDADDALPFEREVGWLAPESFGSWTVGDHATMGFTLPRNHCHAADFDFKVHPFIVASRPALDVQVYANGALMTTWRFAKQDTGQVWHQVVAPIRTPDPRCRVDLRFVFDRPGASPPPYPEGEDRRPLQLLFFGMQPARGTSETVAGR